MLKAKLKDVDIALRRLMTWFKVQTFLNIETKPYAMKYSATDTATEKHYRKCALANPELPSPLNPY
jgi:hypothetical protein